MNTTDELLGVAESSSTTVSVSKSQNPVIRRYSDAYLTARVIVGLGKFVKGTAVFCFIIGVVVLFIAMVSREDAAWVAGPVAAGVAIPLYVLGVIVSAQGQILRASLDTAVHSSPYLTDAERLQVMSLPPMEAVC